MVLTLATCLAPPERLAALTLKITQLLPNVLSVVFLIMGIKLPIQQVLTLQRIPTLPFVPCKLKMAPTILGKVRIILRLATVIVPRFYVVVRPIRSPVLDILLTDDTPARRRSLICPLVVVLRCRQCVMTVMEWG